MATVPNKPSEGHCAACLRPRPAVPVHHRQTSAENVNASQRSGVEDARPALAFKKRQSQQHDYVRAKLERVLNEFFGKRERWICKNALAAFR